SITVVAEGESLVTEKEPDLNPVPAGVVIPVDSIAVAKFEKAENFDYQTVTINLRDDGFEPSVLLMQKGLPALWIINNDSLDPGNSRLIVPSAYAQLDLTQGDNALQLMPFEDFDFSTADNVFYGYVKVTDDIGGADIDAIKAEVSNHETMIYPDAYFEQAAQGMSCCR
ncbi:MAG: heavy metal transporter, partial [Treponema sp.]|nr:heavy metal transporter [Treponema sp.]